MNNLPRHFYDIAEEAKHKGTTRYVQLPTYLDHSRPNRPWTLIITEGPFRTTAASSSRRNRPATINTSPLFLNYEQCHDCANNHQGAPP